MAIRPRANHPGRVLHDEVMKPLGISRNKLARDIDVPADACCRRHSARPIQRYACTGSARLRGRAKDWRKRWRRRPWPEGAWNCGSASSVEGVTLRQSVERQGSGSAQCAGGLQPVAAIHFSLLQATSRRVQ